MFKSGIFSFWHNLLSILPKAEAAAVLMIPLPLEPLFDHFLKVSMNPTTVMGLTIPEAADSRGTSSSTGQQFWIPVTVYSAHAPFSVVKETFLPIKNSPSGLPALMTSPNPYRPPIKFG